jgi:hypothetical protein
MTDKILENVYWLGEGEWENPTFGQIAVKDGKHSVQIFLPRVAYNPSSDVVTVYKPDQMFGELTGSQINWSALGSKSITTAQYMVMALEVAQALALKFDSEAGLG